MKTQWYFQRYVARLPAAGEMVLFDRSWYNILVKYWFSVKQAPWYVVNADDKACARLDCIRHLLSLIPYKDLTPPPIKLPPRRDRGAYGRPPITDQTFVPEAYRPA